MAKYSGVVIESQVDWLTVSAHGQDSARNMLDLALGLAKEEAAKGNKERRWHLMGYEGSHVGAIEYGQRDKESTIVRAIGDSANRNLDVLLSLADTVTRIDLATTWRAEPPDPLYGRNAYALAELYHSSHPRSARPWFTGDADGGFTCYVGARESDSFLRIYNKGQEAVALGDAAGAERYRACWRVELESKASMAAALADATLNAADRPNFVQSYLYAYTQAHGIEAPFSQAGGQSLLPGFRRRSDEDSRLKHLARNVRPTVEWLQARGKDAEVRESLGFDRTGALLRELEGFYPSARARVDTPPQEGR